MSGVISGKSNRLLRYPPLFALAVGLLFMISPAQESHGQNRLKDSDSPYLLKHAGNPVDWYEWGKEAFDKAKKENKLIFLSIGYTACHWCNELEKEAFDHKDFADVINARYVSVKVDREERPDIDAIYMQAAIALEGHGGWPNNVFLAPSLNPVFAVGFQRREKFKSLLVKVDEYWRNNPEEVEIGGAKIGAILKDYMERGGDFKSVSDLDLGPLKSMMDHKYGGFGETTKFPMTTILEYLLTAKSDDKFLVTTLDNMARGGLFDHVGGGFHRYSTDPKWETPHFEKMLYDNALLASLYARAAFLLGNPEYENVAKRTLEFMKRELLSPEGGFLSSLDADSEGEEGKYYIWTLKEVESILNDPSFVKDYGLTSEGNVYDIVVTASGAQKKPTGANTLRRASADRHDKDLEKLFKAREKRERPALDDKVIASWHALAVSAFARAGMWLNDPKLVEQAEKGARFTLDRLKGAHVWRRGKVSGHANLNDVAFSAMAFWDLFEATGKDEYLKAAKDYVDRAKKNFSAGDGGYFLVEKKDDLIARPRVVGDNPVPNSAAVLARVDWRLSAVLGEPKRADDAVKTASHVMGLGGGVNLFTGEAMSLYKETLRKPVELVYAFSPDEKSRMKWLNRGSTRQWGVVRIPLGAESIYPTLIEGRYPAKDTRAYVCLDTVCLAPSESPDEIGVRLEQIEQARAKPDSIP